jgi:diguanylate cyclase (GGDEF)-like protein
MRGDLVKVGDTIFKYLAGSDVEAAYHEEIYRMTIVDGLTGAYNKRYFLEYLEQEIARSQRYARTASLVMIDLDHFKQVNDTHGHLAGDYTLRELAQVSRALVGEAGTFSRYGGEEFALVLPETTLPAACAMADDLRLAIEQHEFVFEQARLPVTASFGVAALSREVRTPEDFIRLADARLYEAKDLGRNRVAF